MAEKIELEVTGFGSLKAQLKEANMEVQKLVQQFGMASPQVAAAAQKAADLKDQIDDSNDAVSAFTGAGKFQAIGKAIQGVAGGFAVVQGAIGLVGGESKELEKTMLKVQSALALTQGLAALEGVADAFGNLKSVAVNAFKGIQAAIGSSGVGLLLVAIGVAAAALINYFNELSDAEKKNKKAVEDSNKALEDQLALMEDLNRRRANDLKIAEANAKLVGKSEEEISEIRRASLIKQRDDAIKAVNEINKAQDLAVSKFKGTEEEKTAMLKKYSDMRNKQIADRNAAETSLELEKIALQQAAADKAKEKTKKDEEDAKNRRKERIKNEKDSLRELNEATRVAEEAFYTEESKKRKIKYDNDLERLREAKAKELEQENLTAQAKENIRLTYIKKENAITYEYNNANAAFQKTKDEEGIAQKKATEEKLAQEAEKRYQRQTKVANEYYDYQQIELDNAGLSEKEYAKQSEDLELKRLEKLLEIAEKNGEDTLEIEKQIAAKKKQIRDNEIADEKTRRNQIFNLSVAAANDLINALQSLSQAQLNADLAGAVDNLEKQEELKKAAFERDKKFQYAKAVMAGIQGGVQAWAQGMEAASLPGAIAFLAISLLTTGIQLAAINKTQYVPGSTKTVTPEKKAVTGSQYAEGGLLMGASHDSGGIQTGFGQLEGGEFVMNRRSTANFLPLLNTLNAMGNTPGPMPTGQQSGSPVIKTYVVASDVTSAQEANARISRLAKL
jgi:hypothetical protein